MQVWATLVPVRSAGGVAGKVRGQNVNIAPAARSCAAPTLPLGSARDSVRLAEERRTQISDQWGEIDVVEQVSSVDAEGQVVAAIGLDLGSLRMPLTFVSRVMSRKSRYDIPKPTWTCPHCGFVHTSADPLEGEVASKCFASTGVYPPGIMPPNRRGPSLYRFRYPSANTFVVLQGLSDTELCTPGGERHSMQRSTTSVVLTTGIMARSIMSTQLKTCT